MARVLDPADLNYLELSDSTTIPGGTAAPSLGGSSSTAEETSKCQCQHVLPRRSKRRVDDIDTIDDEIGDRIADGIGEVTEAIDELRELYKAIECIKRESKKSKNDVLERMVKMNEEKEERLQKFMVEQQVVMAKIIADAVKDAVGRRLDSPAD